MGDVFKKHNKCKHACSVCPPFEGENTGLKRRKAEGRRRARRMLKVLLMLEMMED